MLEQLKTAQEAEQDNREAGIEAANFVSTPGGQWEETWRNAVRDGYQGEFDLTAPMIDQICGTIARNDFDTKVLPASGAASKATAKMFDGLVRHIEAISNARETYDYASRSSAIKGIDGWEVAQRYVDSDSFDQDLVIRRVPNYLESVWHGPHYEQDASDAKYAWKLTGLTKEEYEQAYPDGNAASVDSGRTTYSFLHRQDLIVVGMFYYLLPVERTLVKMKSGAVYEKNADFNAMLNEMIAAGDEIEAERKRTKLEVWTRKFDTDDWLGDAQKTVFENWIPLIPCYSNFDYVEQRLVYFGAVQKMMDWQRVFNYSMSREVTEGALAPKGKYWATPKQVAGHEKTIETLNTNNDPVQLYNPDERTQGPPVWQGGAQVNAGLRTISETMRTGIGMGSGLFSASMGDNPGLQSGVAIDALQERGDVGGNKYIEARKIAQRHTGRILVNAIPRVYLPGRQVRILDEDGSFDIETIGVEVIDNETGQMVVLNNLAEGTFDVITEAGPAFSNRQSQTVRALTELGTVDPSVIELGGDIIARNIPAPGMDAIAARKRRQLFQSGVLLPNELTEEEQAELQQMQQQPPQEDPAMVLARAEEGKAQADIITAQTKQMEAQADIQNKQQENQIRAYEAETKRFEAEIDKVKAVAEIKAKGAQSAKYLAEAEAIDIDNDSKVSGLSRAMEAMTNG